MKNTKPLPFDDKLSPINFRLCYDAYDRGTIESIVGTYCMEYEVALTNKKVYFLLAGVPGALIQQVITEITITLKCNQ